MTKAQHPPGSGWAMNIQEKVLTQPEGRQQQLAVPAVSFFRSLPKSCEVRLLGDGNLIQKDN